MWKNQYIFNLRVWTKTRGLKTHGFCKAENGRGKVEFSFGYVVENMIFFDESQMFCGK